MNTNTCVNTSQLVILGLMTAILLLMAYTPLGYLNIGPLAVTFNMIPVAVSAIALGPFGGAVTGAIFGLTSFLQCTGVCGTSVMGAILFNINPVLAFIQRFFPRLIDGLLLGYIFNVLRRFLRVSASCVLTGFLAAFLNTLLFMAALILLFGRTEYVQGLIGGKNIIIFVCGFVGFSAVCEMIVSSVITGAVGLALIKARFVQAPGKYHK